MNEKEHRTEEDVEREQEVEDLDVPEGQQKDVGGGSIKMTDILISSEREGSP